MTTTIFTNLLEPFCELYYKMLESYEIQQKTINCIRNYGAQNNTLNFGFEIKQPITFDKVFSPTIQLGVFTTNSRFKFQNEFTSIGSYITLPEMSGIITYKNKTLPLIVNLSVSQGSVAAFTTTILTNGVPYDSNFYVDQKMIQKFESEYCLNDSNSILIFVNFQDSTVIQTGQGPTLTNNSLFDCKVLSYRILNGYGQFNSVVANQTFINLIQSKDLDSTYEMTYSFVYNWRNSLAWNPDFNTWYAANQNSVNIFIQKFITDYF
jgi:hypothetical protein